MKVEKYPNFKQAIRSLTKEDREYVFVRHVLAPGEEVVSHYHPKANECIVVNRGRFILQINGEEQEFDLQRQVLVIFLPACQAHSLMAVSQLSYYVFRDRPDEIIYCLEDD